MRLLFCIDNFAAGGAQRQMVALADGLIRRGHEIEFYVYYPHIDHFAHQVEALGSPVHVHHKSHRYSLAPLFALARLVRTNRFDATLAFLRTPVVYAELAKLIAPRTPLVVSERSMYEQIPPRLRLQQELHRLADWITVNSQQQRLRMIRAFPWMASKISTIYNGVDLDTFLPDLAVDLTNKEPSRPLTLLAVGSTTRNKNAMGLARALADLKRRGSPLPEVDWAGEPTGPNAERAKAEVDAFLTAERLESNWKWLGKRSDIPELMRRYDALVHPALMEGLPNAICEALASGLPVIAGNVGDNAYLVGEDRGLLFDPSDPTDIARSIHDFATFTADERLVMAKRARRFAEAELSLSGLTTNYEALFRRLIAGGKGRS